MLTEMVILGSFARLLYKRELPGISTVTPNFQNQICIIGDLSSKKTNTFDQKEGGIVNATFVK